MEDISWLMPGNYNVPNPKKSKEPPLVRLALDTLNDEQDSVLRNWIEIVFPYILDYFSLRDAKGTSYQSAKELTEDLDIPVEKREKIINKLVNLKDQSLAVHLLNAALGGWTLVKLGGLDELQQRYYLAAMTMHDLNKIVLPRLGSTRMDGKEWEKYKTAFLEWGEALHLWDFIARQYWQDVAFLAQNAEDARGANLTLANFPDLQLPPNQLMDLVDFVRFGDLVASIAHHPDDLEQESMRGLLRRTVGGKYIIRSHRTNENRGLLTQAIHNAVLEQAEKVNWKAFLFFPDGVTYFAPKDSNDPDLSKIPKAVRNNTLEIVKKGVGSLVTREGKGIKYYPDLVEVANVSLATETIIRRTFGIISEKKTPVTGARRDKIRQKFAHLSDLDWEYPANLQTDRLAEGLNGITGLIEDYYGLDKEAIAQHILNSLKLTNYFEDWKRIPSDGGVPHSWYYLAGHYMRQHPTLNESELEQVMLTTVPEILQQLGKPDRPPPFAFLDQYIAQVLTVTGSTEKHNFKAELDRYHLNKAKRKREAICSICNSAFDIREEFSNYSNKRVTSGSKESKRGICTICQVEKLLRRYGMDADLVPENETIYLHLYPAYYFTPETALMMKLAYDNFAQSSFVELDKDFFAQEYNPNYVPRLDIFRIGLDPNENLKRRTKKGYATGKMHGYYLLGIPYLGEKPTDTEAWYMAAIKALLAPITFGVKLVASRNPVPVYNSGADFKETIIIDGVHTYWLHGMKETIFRLDELEKAIPAVFSIYSLTAQAYKDSRNFPVWNQLNTVCQSLDTSPLYVFHYADRIQANSKAEDLPMWLAEKLIHYYEILISYYKGDDPMQMIRDIVDKYACFYRASGFAAYARLRPLNVAMKVVLDSLPHTSKDDLKLMIEGHLIALVDGVLDKQTDGYIPEEVKKDIAQRQEAIETFSGSFLEQVFYDYCKGERSLLRQHINLIRKGSEAYYVKTYSKKKNQQETK
ncbi:CRISPR-associated protein Csc3 [Crinalium epipsammum PCC 9333]|uniref:CRISPR-associated protein Csc3 n=1 Tax=Crinalium epipsammum PCC 9333 TaxID=1173022 RepID=K9VXA2_9CYAN|nr:type I-D CRISPR-associated protein Cas10d/Csc3 [Crinalium epipsammum]AFZ11795.1 CRISPR-associated protein Csc3 [Crinalium epipsammum PCC 9333]